MKHDDSRMDEPLPDAAEVRQAYDKLPSTDVPAELDARILARARAAASEPNKVVAFKQPAIKRWAIPISAAASIVIVMSVVYETQFSTPRGSPVALTTSIEQGGATPLEEDRAMVPAAPAADVSAKEPAAARAAQLADSISAKVTLPAPPSIAPIVSPPAIVSLAESVAPAAPAISIPLPSAALSERAVVANELHQDKKEQDSNVAARADASAVTAQPQLLGKLGQRAEAQQSPPPLERLAGHYTYESYSIVTPSGRVRDLHDVGYAAATLDINAQGTLTLTMTLNNGKTTVQTAKIVDAKLDGDSGYWIAQWPDRHYPVKAELSLEGDQLFSTTRFTNPADGPRFGSLEQVTLRRTASK